MVEHLAAQIHRRIMVNKVCVDRIPAGEHLAADKDDVSDLERTDRLFADRGSSGFLSAR